MVIFVIDHEHEWFEIRDAAVLSARRYLAQPDNDRESGVRVVNLCRTSRYQGRGYYVSLLAEARGQRPLPDVKTVEDLKSEARVRSLSSQLEALVRETLHHDESDRFELNVYFGKDPAQRHPALAEKVFASVRAPLLRARFERAEGQLAPRRRRGDRRRRRTGAAPCVPARGGEGVHGGDADSAAGAPRHGPAAARDTARPGRAAQAVQR